MSLGQKKILGFKLKVCSFSFSQQLHNFTPWLNCNKREACTQFSQLYPYKVCPWYIKFGLICTCFTGCHLSTKQKLNFIYCLQRANSALQLIIFPNERHYWSNNKENLQQNTVFQFKNDIACHFKIL